MKQIAAALLKAQKEMGNAIKGSSNPFFKSKYADLNSVREACMPALNNNGIVVLQPTVIVDGKNYVKTLLLHESGEQIEGFTEILFKVAGDAQGQGSGISYARRYGLQSLTCIGADDDDANLASKPQPTKQQPQKTVQDDYLQDWIDELNKCKTLADVTKLYNDNVERVSTDEKIKALFTKRKSEVPN